MGTLQSREFGKGEVEEQIDKLLVDKNGKDSMLGIDECINLSMRYSAIDRQLERVKKEQPFIANYDQVRLIRRTGALGELLHLLIIGKYGNGQVILIQFVNDSNKYILVEDGNYLYRGCVMMLREWHTKPDGRQGFSIQLELLVDDKSDNISFVKEVRILDNRLRMAEQGNAAS